MFTHKQLCEIARMWLKRSLNANAPACDIVFVETKNNVSGEIVDAIGFKVTGIAKGSTIVEVKTSREDFFKDQHKPHRRNPELGLGLYRYFMVPKGLISIDELPEKWGLIEVSNKCMIKVVKGHVLDKNIQNWQFNRYIEAENSLLIKTIARFNNLGNLDVVKENSRLKGSNYKLAVDNQLLRDQLTTAQYEIYILKHKLESLGINYTDLFNLPKALQRKCE